MKKIFIETKYKGDIRINQEELKSLPKNLLLVGTVQYIDFFEEIIQQLKQHKINATIAKTLQPNIGQILGCDVTIKDNIPNAVLYVGDGMFHPIKIAFTYDCPVFTYSPQTGYIKQIDSKKVEIYKKRKKGALIKFLSSDTIGILFTTKPGQNMKESILTKLENKYPDKKFYKFTADEINFQGLENFPFIQAWVNTACPRIEEDFRCVNIGDILDE